MSTVTVAEAEKALEKAKIHLMATPETVFFTTLCFSLIHKICESVPTAATNGREIRYNPKFFTDLTEPQRVFLIMHETLHCAFLHGLRKKAEWDHTRWNHACDYAINDILDQAGFEMPPGCLLNDNLRGMGAEEIYPLIPPPPPGSGHMNDLDPNGIPDPNAKPMTEEEMNDILMRASLQAEMANQDPGRIPGDLARIIDKLRNPKLSWHALLRRYMTAFAKTNYTFQKPNRRFFPDHILPSAHGESLEEIAIAVDTSGSISEEEFQHFLSETMGILKQLKPKAIKFIQFDYGIQAIDEIRNEHDLKKVEFTGGGGTCIDEVMRWAEKEKPLALLMFTDGWFSPVDPPGKVPVMWIIHTNTDFTSDYGRVIPYNFE